MAIAAAQKNKISKLESDSVFLRNIQRGIEKKILSFSPDELKITYHSEKSDWVLDPACGSGGFPLHAMDSVRHFAEANYDEGEARVEKMILGEEAVFVKAV